MNDADWQSVIDCAYAYARRKLPPFMRDWEDLAGHLIEECWRRQIHDPKMCWNVFAWETAHYIRTRGAWNKDGVQVRPLSSTADRAPDIQADAVEPDFSALDVDRLIEAVHLMNEAAARVVVMLHRGYPPAEIAELTKTSKAHVSRHIDMAAAIISGLDGYRAGDDGGHRKP